MGGEWTVHGSIWERGWFIEHSTHLHHRHKTRNATKAEKESVEEHATFGDDENLRR
jgi:hypothetical protein